MMRLCGCLMAILAVASGQLMPNMPQITKMDVQCAKSGMTVDIEFNVPFNGIIFSKGHFSDPTCRFVAKDSDSTAFRFDVPMSGCGTQPLTEGLRTGFENVLFVQNEELVMEVWDTARRISCLWQSRLTKNVLFNPFSVNAVDVADVQVDGDDVTCWMNVLSGRSPFGRKVDGIVRIGDPMTVAIYVQDGGSGFDVSVRNCYAYDNGDTSAATTAKLQLSDASGCSLKPKLFENFIRTRQTEASGADVIAYAVLNAFKFPDSMQVYLACEVELCKDGCDAVCDRSGEDTGTGSVSQLPPTTTAEPRTTTVFVCVPGSLDSRCPPICVPGSSDPRCPTTTTTTTTTPAPTTTVFTCVPGSLDSRCPPTCVPGSVDPRCPTTTTSTTTTTIPTTTTPAPRTTVFTCVPGSLDPRCPPTCVPGSVDPRCPTTTTTTSTTTTTTTTTPAPTTTIFTCVPGSLDSRCPPTCVPGSTDPRCPTTTTTTTTPEPTTTVFTCVPGSLDPRCPPTCVPGSVDPRCPTTTTTTTTTTTAFTCVPGSEDLRCPPTCLPGTSDPRCPTTTRRTTPRPSSGDCDGPDDPRCSPNHAFHAWQYKKPPGTRRPFNGQPMRPHQAAIRRKRDLVASGSNAVSLMHAFQVISPSELELDWNTLSANQISSVQSAVQRELCLSTAAFSAALLVPLVLAAAAVALAVRSRCSSPRKCSGV